MIGWNQVGEPWQEFLRNFPNLAWIWITMVGACIGSFLNVVVYRLPAGLSLLHPGSHCPRCNHAIRWYDNVPILGWMWLRGRCRDCRSSISVRYPLVELLTAAVFALVWYHDVVRESNTEGPSSVSLVHFVWHAVWFTLLLVIALIDGDGRRVPTSLFLFGALAALTLALCGADWIPIESDYGVGGCLGQAMGGILLGAALAWFTRFVERRLVATPRTRQKDPGSFGDDLRLMSAIGGLSAAYLGVATAIPVLLIATFASWRTRSRDDAASGVFRFRWAVLVAVVTLIWLFSGGIR